MFNVLDIMMMALAFGFGWSQEEVVTAVIVWLVVIGVVLAAVAMTVSMVQTIAERARRHTAGLWRVVCFLCWATVAGTLHCNGNVALHCNGIATVLAAVVWWKLESRLVEARRKKQRSCDYFRGKMDRKSYPVSAGGGLWVSKSQRTGPIYTANTRATQSKWESVYGQQSKTRDNYSRISFDTHNVVRHTLDKTDAEKKEHSTFIREMTAKATWDGDYGAMEREVAAAGGTNILAYSCTPLERREDLEEVNAFYDCRTRGFYELELSNTTEGYDTTDGYDALPFFGEEMEAIRWSLWSVVIYFLCGVLGALMTVSFGLKMCWNVIEWCIKIKTATSGVFERWSERRKWRSDQLPLWNSEPVHAGIDDFAVPMEGHWSSKNRKRGDGPIYTDRTEAVQSKWDAGYDGIESTKTTRVRFDDDGNRATSIYHSEEEIQERIEWWREEMCDKARMEKVNAEMAHEFWHWDGSDGKSYNSVYSGSWNELKKDQLKLRTLFPGWVNVYQCFEVNSASVRDRFRLVYAVEIEKELKAFINGWSIGLIGLGFIIGGLWWATWFTAASFGKTIARVKEWSRSLFG